MNCSVNHYRQWHQRKGQSQKDKCHTFHIYSSGKSLPPSLPPPLAPPPPTPSSNASNTKRNVIALISDDAVMHAMHYLADNCLQFQLYPFWFIMNLFT